MGGHLRERFNAKARQSSHKSGKKRKRSNATEEDGTTKGIEQNSPIQQDSNAEVVVLKSKEQKEEERRERMRKELMEQANSKFSSKKKRRLEKYIDNKLKKEERGHILEKLAQTQAELSSTLVLQSSATLGTGRTLTNEQRLAKEENIQIRRVIDGRSKGKRKRAHESYTPASSDEEEEESEKDEPPRRARPKPGDVEKEDEIMEFGDEDYESDHYSPTLPTLGSTRDMPVVVTDDAGKDSGSGANGGSVTVIDIGAGLKKNADGSVIAPKVVKRQPKGSRIAFRSWGKAKANVVPSKAEVGAESDSSFDSSDSANDSADEEEAEDESGGSNLESGESGADEDEGSGEDGEDGDEESEEEEEENPPANTGKRKRLGFKEWAQKQLDIAKGFTNSATADTTGGGDASRVANATTTSTKASSLDKGKPSEMRGPLGEDLHLPNNFLTKQVQKDNSSRSHADTQLQSDAPVTQKPSKPVRPTLSRPPEVQEARLQLPIIAEEQPIVEAVRLNPVVVLCGETGSGKTTQVPQFLYEAGFGVPGSENPGMIGITQPRRVAAMSMASRVAHELSLTSSKVSYQIRYDATVSPDTSIKFMTDGVLLRELVTDFTLSKYSVIIVDEAHERSVNTDILIGVLSRVVKLRGEMWEKGERGVKPLRLIIMSATLRVEDFVSNGTLFSTPPPVINVAARQHPVTVHFNRRTSPDYVNEAIKKAVKIHARLPPGGILIFLTGQNEISGVCRRLEARFGKSALDERKARRRTVNGKRKTLEGSDEGDAVPEATTRVAPSLADVEPEEIDLGVDNAQVDEAADEEAAERDADALDSEDDSDNDEVYIDMDDTDVPMHVLPLYSLLPTDRQMRVFEPPPDGSRLVVVSTNVAETSLTIPGIRYVIDCGRAKERCYDPATGVQTFRVNWISKASASQRAGRAGRTGPGHCYRLFSSALFEHHFDKFAQPEILKMPIEGIVLQMKSMHIDTVTNFPFPTPPDRTSLRKAEKLLMQLGALESVPGNPLSADGRITELGKAMALFPLSPRFAKMLVSGQQRGCLPYVIAIVSALSVGDPFIHEEVLRDEEDREPDEDLEDLSQIMSEEALQKEKNRLRRKAFFKGKEMHSRLGNGASDVLRILSVVGAYEYAKGGVEFCNDHFVRPKAMEEIHKLRAQISNIVKVNFPNVDAGFVQGIQPPTDLQIKVLRQLLCASFIDHVAVRKDIVLQTSSSGTKFASSRGIAYRVLGLEDDAFIHPSSVLFSKSPPDFIIYQEAARSSRLWVKTCTTVNSAWLAVLGKDTLCTFSKPTKNSRGELMVIPRFGPENWELPAIRADKVTVN